MRPIKYALPWLVPAALALALPVHARSAEDAARSGDASTSSSANDQEPQAGAREQYANSRLGPHGELTATRENVMSARELTDAWKAESTTRTKTSPRT